MNRNRSVEISTWLVPFVLYLVAGYMLWRTMVPPRPAFFVRAHGTVSNAQWADGAWYWMEAVPKRDFRLVRSAPGGAPVTLAAAGVRAFAAGSGKVAWIASENKDWSVHVASSDGSSPATVWSGAAEASGVSLAGGRAYWMLAVAPPVPRGDPFPPLSPSLRLWGAPLAGGPPTALADVMELHGGRVLGEQGGQVYLTTSRLGLQSATAVYAVAAAGGAARRLTAYSGDQDALLTRSGELYTVGPSREASDPTRIACIGRRSGDGKTEWLVDWLPAGGQMHEESGQVFYVARAGSSIGAWHIRAGDRLPNAVPIPEGYDVLAIGNGEVLLRSAGMEKDEMLYRVSLP